MTNEQEQAKRFQSFVKAVQDANLDVDGTKQSLHSTAVVLNFQDGPGSTPKTEK